jgi:hypothetical protein
MIVWRKIGLMPIFLRDGVENCWIARPWLSSTRIAMCGVTL